MTFRINKRSILLIQNEGTELFNVEITFDKKKRRKLKGLLHDENESNQPNWNKVVRNNASEEKNQNYQILLDLMQELII